MKDLPIFVKWLELTDWVLHGVQRFPRHTRFILSNRMGERTLDIMEDIVTAIYTKNRGELLDRINRNLEIMRVLYRIAYGQHYISEKQYRYIAKELNETGRMVGGWKRSGGGVDEAAP